MLALDPDQLDALLRLDRRRFAQALAALLPEAWPTVAARVGERATDFVAAALDAADREGLGDSRLLAAALLNLWCLWGPGFESRPGFEWARALLDARERSPELRMVQLVEQTRERLRGPAPAAPVPAAAGATLAQFDAGLQRLVAAAQEAALRGVFVPRPEPATLPAPCDLRELELAVTPAEGRQEYRRGDDGVWRLQPVPPRAATLRIEARPASALALAALSAPARAGAHARLRLRLQPGALCDPTRHPAVTIDGPQGRLGWRGRDAAALALALEGPALPAPDASIGLVEPLRQRIAVETCGIRAAGEPIGVLSAEVAIHPSAQHLLESRLPALPLLALPRREGEPPAAPPQPSCRFERDGVALDAAPWVRAWQGLARAVAQGLERLLAAWAKAPGLEQPRLEASVSALEGHSLLTWGARETDDGSDAFMRLEGGLELAACALDVALSGVLSAGAARARVRLRAQGRCELHATLARTSPTLALTDALAAAVASWRFPFEAEVEPVAGGELAAAMPFGPAAPGALLGSAGLRTDDAGRCEWFFGLALEPASVGLLALDPVRGRSTCTRALLPALALVDWSSA